MSKIQWCDETWNVTAGCSKVSEGCLNCYAERMAYRLAWMGQEKYIKVMDEHGDNDGWNGSVYCDESALDKPLHWKKPRRIFVCSMSDLFHPQVPFEFIDKVGDIINRTQQHTYQILTKRSERMLEYFSEMFWPTTNVHLGVSVELQKYTPRIEDLLEIPAAKRFVSFEPLLGEIKLLDGYFSDSEWHGLDYIIIGAESIGGAAGRECKLEWAESLVDQAKAAGVLCGVKQIHVGGKLLKYNKKEHSWPDAWPEKLRVWEI